MRHIRTYLILAIITILFSWSAFLLTTGPKQIFYFVCFVIQFFCTILSIIVYKK